MQICCIELACPAAGNGPDKAGSPECMGAAPDLSAGKAAASLFLKNLRALQTDGRKTREQSDVSEKVPAAPVAPGCPENETVSEAPQETDIPAANALLTQPAFQAEPRTAAQDLYAAMKSQGMPSADPGAGPENGSAMAPAADGAQNETGLDPKLGHLPADRQVANAFSSDSLPQKTKELKDPELLQALNLRKGLKTGGKASAAESRSDNPGPEPAAALRGQQNFQAVREDAADRQGDGRGLNTHPASGARGVKTVFQTPGADPEPQPARALTVDSAASNGQAAASSGAVPPAPTGIPGLSQSAAAAAEPSLHVSEKGGRIAADIKADIMTQIVDRAILERESGLDRVRIDLKPEFLGHVRMQVTTENNHVTLKILAELPAVREVMEQNIQQLKNELVNQGMQVESVHVDLFGASHSGGQNADAEGWHTFRDGPERGEEQTHRADIAAEAGQTPLGKGQEHESGRIDFFA